MSATGDALGAAILANKAAAQNAFRASLRGRPALPTDNARLVLMLAQAEGNAIADAIVAGRRIFIGTNPNPDPAQFQDGDIYFVKET